jgi:hypothetical protein
MHRYMDHCDQFIAHFADIHRHNEAVPDVIIVFGLEFYANQSQVNFIVYDCKVQVESCFVCIKKNDTSCWN